MLIFTSSDKPSLSSDVENVVKVSHLSSYLSQQATTMADAVPSSSLSQMTAGTRAVPKPKITPNKEELNKDMNIAKEILVSLYRKRDLGQASESHCKVILNR